MPASTVVASNARAIDSRFFIANRRGQVGKVASVTTTTVVLDDAGATEGIALFSATNPGQLVIAEGVGTSDNGKTADITGITSNTLTVDVDFATTPAIADGDYVYVCPPLAKETFASSGHTLAVDVVNDDTLGMAESMLSHNTRLGARVSGDVPFFATIDSEAFSRILLAGIGSYVKSSTGVHDFVPTQSKTGSYADAQGLALYSEDGNGVIRQAWPDLFATGLSLTVPTNGIVTGSLSCIGTGVVREIGGSGKLFTQGANNYVPAAGSDRGPRHTGIGAFVELGGSFGDALTDSNDRFVQDLTINIARGAVEESTLGNQFIVRPVEDVHSIEISGTRLLQNDTFFEDYHGQTTDAEPGSKIETRMLVHLISQHTAARTLTFDVPKGFFQTHGVERQRGFFKERFTFKARHSLTAGGAYDTAAPLYRARHNSGLDTDLITAL